MLGGARTISNYLTRSNGSSWTLVSQQIWRSPQSRAICSIKITPSPTQEYKPLPSNEIISRRFLHRRRPFDWEPTRERSSASSLSKLFSRLKTLLLIGTGVGAVYFTFQDGTPLFYTTQCACPPPPPPKPKIICNENNECCMEKRCQDSNCLRMMECEEELIVKANRELDRALGDVKGKAVEYTESAMKAYCEAIALMHEYINNAYCLLDSDEIETPIYEENWCCLYKITRKRCEKVREAIIKGRCAWALLRKLKEVIDAGNACKYTSCNPLLPIAQEALTCAEKELSELEEKMANVAADHDMVKEWKDVIEKFKKEMNDEMCSIPEDEQCPIEYVEQQNAIMINLAYAHVLKVHNKLAWNTLKCGKIPEKQKKTHC